jgi:transcription elongation factor GreA
MSKINYLTEEGYKKLKEELEHMVAVQRPSISAQIAEARDKGDLSENAEYDAAKEAQGLLEGKISKLQEALNNSRILDNSNVDISKVSLLSKVKIKNKKNNALMEYQIVSENEANLKEGKISSDSPIGKALLGLKEGESVDVQVPSGLMTFEVVKISK